MQNPTTFGPQGQLKLVNLSTWDQIRELKHQMAIKDNERRLKALFQVSAPPITAQSPVSITEAPSYMGYSVEEFEDSVPCYDWDQYGGGW